MARAQDGTARSYMRLHATLSELVRPVSSGAGLTVLPGEQVLLWEAAWIMQLGWGWGQSGLKTAEGVVSIRAHCVIPKQHGSFPFPNPAANFIG